MPTSYGSMGKQYPTVFTDIKFSRFVNLSSLKIHFHVSSILTTTPLKPCFLLDTRVLEINNELTDYSIKGVTAKFNVGHQQIVRLYDEKTGSLIREIKTNDVGEFSFHQLNPDKKYTLTTKDEDGTLESVILDTISPKINS